MPRRVSSESCEGSADPGNSAERGARPGPSHDGDPAKNRRNPSDNKGVECSVAAVSSRGEEIFLKQIEASRACLEASKVLAPQIARAADLLTEVLGQGGRVLACGNGGSATDASHFTTELLCRLKNDRQPFPALSLAADSGFLTATANDYGYDQVFARQVEGLGTAGDALLGISTSGNSPNIVKALEAARAGQLRSVSLLGRDGGRCKGLADIEIIVPSPSTARIQEAHQVIIHTLCLLTEHQLLGMPDAL